MKKRILASALAATLSALLPTMAALGQADTPGNAAAGVPQEQQLGVLRAQRDSLMAVRDFAAALAPAAEIVTSQEPDLVAHEDHSRLARIQAELGEYDDAELSYLRAIELLERREGEFSITLVDVYRGLGRSYIRGGQYPEAITALEQAQHITQRHLGLFNTEQTGLIDDITTAYLGAGDTTAARDMQLERLGNALRRFGEDDLRVVPFRLELASYYQRSRLPVSAREQYLEVLRIENAEVGADHPVLLRPLRELVAIDLALTQGEDAESHARLVSLLERNGDGGNPFERGLSLAVLGDWAIVHKDVPGAHEYYRRAWQAVQASEADPQAVFGAPAMIDFVAPLNSVDRGTRSRPYAWAEIVLAFDVAADGTPANVRMVRATAPVGVLADRYARRVRETRFRPRLVLGEPAATANVEFTHYFRYYVARDADDG